MFQMSGGVPRISHSRRALCRAIMWSRVINCLGRECGGKPPRSKCRVVDAVNVSHDHRARGASRWIAILGR